MEPTEPQVTTDPAADPAADTLNAAPPAAPPVDLAEGAAAAVAEALAADAAPEPAKPAEAEKPAAPADPAKLTASEAEKPAAAPAEDEMPAGLSQKSQERFRELAPYKAAFKQAGIEKAEDLPKIVERAKFADELESAIVDTGATPEQYGAAIQYLALINSGQPAMLEKAFEVMQAELATLAKTLGKEAPGVHDPLAEHSDLREEVENGDITRKRALEIASQRAAGSLAQQNERAASEQAAQRAAYDGAIAELNALGSQLSAADPMYSSKIAALKPTIALIREHCPPSEWVQRVGIAYRQVVVSAPAPSAPSHLPPPGPVRSVSPAGVSYAAEAKSPEEAIRMALAAMGGGR
ncbi:hypothetical protein [Ralstonia sp.]|uniref:hypothetical protein n=1 Tax=Ralstonia sp. TaxID=54061 RepID=UPI00257FBB74|nr:hypothetical protein [Ralstonia sp.]MBA4203146.1 hypothetical protein [Ralstonia sp.]MBA4279305.1 hypothetical protein [Ralstonia sp.]